MSKNLDRISSPCCGHDQKQKQKSDCENSEDRMNVGFLRKAKNVSSKVRSSLRNKIRRKKDVGVCEIEDIREIEEQKIVDAFGHVLIADNLLPEGFDDYHVMLRFLKARKFRVEEAKIMWANMLQWRKDFGVDIIMEDLDFKELNEITTSDRFVKYQVQEFEKTLAISHPHTATASSSSHHRCLLVAIVTHATTICLIKNLGLDEMPDPGLHHYRN
ncbi:Phosphatidylinositol/phosphatidylcholine transfer protein SFH8 [Sesamum alatum]|uniref:Phosphatidylinositol/phosphatidylcholine transfer protein SFH8 n=1 Tax=Sesamum alatum TaxID=300844 RepID=A0AAE2CCP8_9LAMI|nr:Phosphatidylinositol/phosphatidylcholine transfer protein SFH8 [Sesamum alatum]